MRPAACQPLAIRPPKGGILGRLGIGVHRLRIEPLGEGDQFIRVHRDGARMVHVALDIVLEVAISYWMRERHSGTHR
jgi:hypothetical protein